MDKTIVFHQAPLFENFNRFSKKLNHFEKNRAQNDGRRGVSDPKSHRPHLELPQTKHLSDSQPRRPPGLRVRRDQRVLWPSAKLLFRRTVSHVFSVNGDVADVNFERSRFISSSLETSHGSQAALKGTLS